MKPGNNQSPRWCGGLLPDVPISSLRANDPDAWETAQPILWSRMWHAVHRKMPMATEAELCDLVAEILCDPVVAQTMEPRSKAFRRLATFSDLVNLASHIAGLRAIDAIRAGTRRGTKVSLDSIQESVLPSGETTSSPGGLDVIQFALAQLDAKYREPIRLHYFEGLGTVQIGENLGISKGQVCSLLSRGREAIRGILEREGLSINAASDP